MTHAARSSRACTTRGRTTSTLSSGCSASPTSSGSTRSARPSSTCAPPPEPVRRERGNGDVYYDYHMPYHVSINGHDSSTDTRSYEAFVEHNKDWGVTADDLVAPTRSFGSSDFLDPELPSDFHPQHRPSGGQSRGLRQVPGGLLRRHVRVPPLHPARRGGALLASDRSSLAALAVDLDGFGARLSYDDLLDGAGDSKSITRCNVRDNDEEWQRRQRLCGRAARGAPPESAGRGEMRPRCGRDVAEVWPAGRGLPVSQSPVHTAGGL